MDNAPVITIDGPSGSGKGTISLQLADALGWHHLDSGVLYRLLAHAALKNAVALDDEAALLALVYQLRDSYRLPTREQPSIMLEGEDVGPLLRTEDCGNAASQVAALPAVRQAMLAWQRAYQQPPGLIADGRDMGSVVFPRAALKLFLTARPGVRAKRRHNQLINMGKKPDLAELTKAVETRDRRDSTREASPLRPADDALLIDNSDLDEAATLARVLDAVKAGF